MMGCCRCQWVNLRNPLYVKYHDEEWGVPSRDDAYLYEMLLLECFVAGLSWECVLNKRAAFREALAGFVPQRVAAFGEAEVRALLANPALIRHRGKLQAAIANSRVFLQIQAEFGSFASYAWGFAGNQVHVEAWNTRTFSPLSDALARDLKRRGMRYVGSVTLYSWLQAVGIVNGHDSGCFRRPVCTGI